MSWGSYWSNTTKNNSHQLLSNELFKFILPFKKKFSEREDFLTAKNRLSRNNQGIFLLPDGHIFGQFHSKTYNRTGFKRREMPRNLKVFITFAPSL